MQLVQELSKYNLCSPNVVKSFSPFCTYLLAFSKYIWSCIPGSRVDNRMLKMDSIFTLGKDLLGVGYFCSIPFIFAPSKIITIDIHNRIVDNCSTAGDHLVYPAHSLQKMFSYSHSFFVASQCHWFFIFRACITHFLKWLFILLPCYRQKIVDCNVFNVLNKFCLHRICLESASSYYWHISVKAFYL